MKKMFSKSDTTNWSYKMYKITEIIKDTIPSYHIDILPICQKGITNRY